MKQQRRVLHIFGRMQRGGAELRTLDILRRLDRTELRFDFCALSGLAGELDSEIESLGGEVHHISLGYKFGHQFRALLRRRHYDAVHSHVHFASGYILRLAAAERVPIRINHFRTTHDGQPDSLRRRLQRWALRKWIDRYATCILAVSQGTLSAVWPRGPKPDPRCEVLYNGLDPHTYQVVPDPAGVRSEFNIPLDAKVCLHVGRMDPAKNHLRLLQIFKELLHLKPDAYLILAGRSEESIDAVLRTYLTREGISHHVRFAGTRSDVPRLLRASDLLILPSLWEGLPGAVLEAAAAGTPAYVSDLAGCREIAAYFGSVRCLPLSDSDQFWAQALCSGLDNQAPVLEPGCFEQSPFDMSRALPKWSALYA